LRRALHARQSAPLGPATEGTGSHPARPGPLSGR
jgi:hypothetical protein